MERVGGKKGREKERILYGVSEGSGQSPLRSLPPKGRGIGSSSFW
jgi:hypothetical protein